jgi:flagellar basal-body rod protein FlgC
MVTKMSLFDMMSISGSALSAERLRAEITSANMANAETTHTDAGGPYVRKEVVFSARNGSPFGTIFAGLGRFAQPPSGSVQLSQVMDDPTPAVMHYEPGSPDANAAGYVAYPAINPASEMVDLMGAVRAYQLNASAVNAAKQMIQESIDILKST